MGSDTLPTIAGSQENGMVGEELEVVPNSVKVERKVVNLATDSDVVSSMDNGRVKTNFEENMSGNLGGLSIKMVIGPKLNGFCLMGHANGENEVGLDNTGLNDGIYYLEKLEGEQGKRDENK
ncbi:hypothetical protein SLA2020_318950 [Shorea laevis]